MMQVRVWDVGAEAQFFIDRQFVDSDDGLELKVNPPAKAGMVLAPEKEWDAYRVLPISVVDDGGTYKMWYEACAAHRGKGAILACPRCKKEAPDTLIICRACGWPLWPSEYIAFELLSSCYVESRDGIHWTRPDLGLSEFRGSRANNRVAGLNCGAVPTLNPKGPPSEKYMLVQEKENKLWVMVSPDGLRWTRKPKPVLPFSADTTNQIIYDPGRDKYVALLRGFPNRRTTVRCEFDSLDQAPWPYQDRGHKPDITGTLYVTDELETALDVDDKDPPLPGLDIDHISACLYAPGIWLGFPAIFRKYPPAGLGREGRAEHRFFARGNDGTWETQLAVSRDGRHWSRPDRSAYVAGGPYGSPDGGLIMAAIGMIRRGNEIYQYYGGQSVTHAVFDPGFSRDACGTFRLVQLKDRFIGLSARGPATRRFVTPPLIHRGRKLELNIDCGGLGEASVQVLDHEAHPIAGFMQEDCDRVDLNQLCHTMTWRGRSDLGATAGKPIRLEFFMRNANLFTFRFAP